ncbi:MAG TPA: hypothetical protein VNT79_11975 [Phycisphaerae bacterium]|nr:hypothetical protein [Phycisphaerae bacterium]
MHHRPTSYSVYVAFALTAAVLILVSMMGCSSERKVELVQCCTGKQVAISPVTVGSAALLFDEHVASPYEATAFRRLPWPSTMGPTESIEESSYYQLYWDYQGNVSQERSSPTRYTRSVRRATQIR